MKHPSSRAFFAYWDGKRGHARAPDRSDIEPGAVRELLADIFVLSHETTDFPFRVAGTRVCALFGRDLKDHGFAALFAAASRSDIQDIVAIVGDEMLPAVAGLTARTPDGTVLHLELLLLPFSNRTHSPISLTGLLVPFETVDQPLSELMLTSWRYIHPPPERIVPRALRKLALARGFMVYEGLG